MDDIVLVCRVGTALVGALPPERGMYELPSLLSPRAELRRLRWMNHQIARPIRPTAIMGPIMAPISFGVFPPLPLSVFPCSRGLLLGDGVGVTIMVRISPVTVVTLV